MVREDLAADASVVVCGVEDGRRKDRLRPIALRSLDCLSLFLFSLGLEAWRSY